MAIAGVLYQSFLCEIIRGVLLIYLIAINLNIVILFLLTREIYQGRG